MGNLIPIKLADAALEAQAKQHQATQAELAVWQDAACALAMLADRAFFYSREERAAADNLIKTIRKLKPNG